MHECETRLKLVQNNRVYFQERFSMKTGIDKDEMDKKFSKISELKLIYLSDPGNLSSEKNIGTFRLDLAKYTDCSDKKEISCPLTGSRLESSAHLECTI